MTTPTIRLVTSIKQVQAADLLVLDDATTGLLNTNKLGGPVDTDLDVPIKSLSISRGRSRQLDRFTSGSASIVFDNSDRRLDPLNTASEFYPDVRPRQRVKIYADDKPIFTGIITDWDIEYSQSYWDTAVASSSDAFVLLSNFAFEEDVTPVAEGPAARLTWLLNLFGYDGEYSFDGGSTVMGAYPVTAGTQALDYAFQVAFSDRSALFADADGVLRLIGIFDKLPTSAVLFSDDGTGIPYMSLMNQYGDELLYNRIVASSPAGTVTVQDDTSIALYDISSYTLPDLLNNSLASVGGVAGAYLSLYANPEVRFTGLTVELAGLSAADVNTLLSLDLTDQITIRKTFKSGSPLVVEQDLIIYGIKHVIQPDSHQVEFMFEVSGYKEPFILNDAIQGILNGNYVLG